MADDSDGWGREHRSIGACCCRLALGIWYLATKFEGDGQIEVDADCGVGITGEMAKGERLGWAGLVSVGLGWFRLGTRGEERGDAGLAKSS
jgi:hypothetical protein